MHEFRVLLIDCSRPLDPLERVGSGMGNQHHPPVGLMAIASYAERSEISQHLKIKVVDSSIDYKNTQELKELIADFAPDMVGLRCLQWYTEQFHWILNHIKQSYPKVITIAGGPYPNGSPKDVMKNDPNLDMVVVGEGEETFLDLLKAYIFKNSIKNVRGIFCRDVNNEIVFTGDRPQNPNIDELGFPNWEKLDFRSYEKIMSHAPIKRKAAPILTSRGCPYKCTYCHELFQKKLRVRSTESVMAELEMLVGLGVKDIIIIDDIFNLDNKRVIQIFDQVMKKNLKLNFYYPNGLRADQMPNHVIDAMVDGGSVQFIYALESGSSRVQKLVKKNLNFEKFDQAMSHTLSRKVMVDVFMMIGFPDETEEEVEQTLSKVFKYNNISFPYLNVLNAFDGTELFSWMEKNDEKFRSQVKPGGYMAVDTLDVEKRMQIANARIRLLTEYVLRNDRLLAALEIQQRFLRTDEIVDKYNYYFGTDRFHSIEDITAFSRK